MADHDAASVLAQEVLASRARRNPAWATQVGLREHDARLRDARAEAYVAALQEVEALLARADALPRGLDRDALATTLALEAFELGEARTWARNPDLAGDFLEHVFALLLAPHLSRDEKLAGLAGRLEGAAAYFEAGWSRFDPAQVPRLWVEGALESARAGPAFLDAVMAFARDAGGAQAARVLHAAKMAAPLLERHVHWLEHLHPHAAGSPSLGEDRFRHLLRLRHIPETPDELAHLGETLARRLQADLEEAALTVLAQHGREGGGADAVDEALALVRADHAPTFHDVLREHDRSIEDARAFVVSRGLATPTDVPLDVVETPPFLRHLIPFAAYIGPPRFAQPRRGTYLVTPKVDLGAFARADVRNTTVHEAWPGHHLQICVAAEHAPLPAFLADAVESIEGWALYCEALLGEHGYTAAPADRLMRVKDALWRAVRIVLDVGLHTGRLTPEEAAARLARDARMSVEEAQAEVLRYTQNPAYNLSYMYGRVKLEALRERCGRAGMGEREFHDRVLRAGPLPVALLERALMTPA